MARQVGKTHYFPNLPGLDQEIADLWSMFLGAIGPEHLRLSDVVREVGAKLIPGQLSAFQELLLKRLSLTPSASSSTPSFTLNVGNAVIGPVLWTTATTFSGSAYRFRNDSGGVLELTGGGSQPILTVTAIAGYGGNPISASNGAYLSNGGTWQNSSSRSLKEEIYPFSGPEALKMAVSIPVYKWRYRGSDEKHISPMSEDLHAEADVGDRHTIAAEDLAGIGLAAVQELASTCRRLEAKVERLERALSHAGIDLPE